MTEILYKYRSLDNFKFFVDIVLNNRLYASKYQDLNDPMEGQYTYPLGELDEQVRNKLFDSKNRLKLCSLSKVKDNQLMWSHYTNGHRGVAIGLRVDEQRYTVRPIRYEGTALIRNQDFNSETARDILCRKLEVWAYEEEVRVFVDEVSYIDIQIEEIITGAAMSNADFDFVKKLVEKINPAIRIIKAIAFMNR